MKQPFEGHVGRTYADSQSWWPPLETAAAGAPNVVIVLLDSLGKYTRVADAKRIKSWMEASANDHVRVSMR